MFGFSFVDIVFIVLILCIIWLVHTINMADQKYRLLPLHDFEEMTVGTQAMASPTYTRDLMGGYYGIARAANGNHTLVGFKLPNGEKFPYGGVGYMPYVGRKGGVIYNQRGEAFAEYLEPDRKAVTFENGEEEPPEKKRKSPPRGVIVGLNSSTVCHCGVPCNVQTVKKKTHNHGKKFYCCAKSNKDQCGFFAWVD